jgi:aminoglycoside 6'-N-acetyltransferase
VDVPPEAVAMDLFIGEPEFRNRGWGTEVLTACLERLVFGEMNAPLAMIAPDPENARAVRSYEKVGFRPVRRVHIEDEDPGNTGWELVMLLDRDKLFIS